MVTYYSFLRILWEELQGYLAPPCSSPYTCGSKALLVKEYYKERVHQFLIWLESNQFSNVLSNMLMREPLLSLNMVFSKAITKERNLAIPKTNDLKLEVIGFDSRSRTSMLAQVFDSQRSNITCNHCNNSGYDQSQCFEVIVYPK